ncbi:MAG TPA: hypothetical protein VGM66_06180 [Candidatus Udaeobacter sp.]
MERGAMPNGIHIAIVVYGHLYTELLSDITLWNVAELVLEIPEDLRSLSRVRILTTESDKATLEAAPALKLLRSRISVDLLDGARLGGYEKHSEYGPMVESQRLLVADAARNEAALIFFGPDLIYSRGSFALFVDCLRKGFRLVIGPGPRVNREAARPLLKQIIAESPDGGFAFNGEQQADFLFKHWHKINDQFFIENPESLWWKAYVCYRPRPNEVLFRFLQGPTFMAWPRKPKDDFDGFVDHHLPDLCCASWRDMYVVPDGNECLALDLTDDDRIEVMDMATFPKVFLLYSFFQHSAVKTLKLLYSLRTCRVGRGEPDKKLVEKWKREFDRALDPLILVALLERKISHRIGPRAAAVFRGFCLLNTHTLGFLFGSIAPILLRKWKSNRPPRGYEPAQTGPNATQTVLPNR